MIACVLKSGGAYRPEHVQRLSAQAAAFAPGEPFVCLSDVPVDGVARVPLQHDWRGWWSKIELFRPDVFPDGMRVLYADLDTTFLGLLDTLLARPEAFVMLSDFYRPERLASGLMLWTAGQQSSLYRRFAADPEPIMAACGVHGDQRFLEGERLGDATRWQDILPGQVVSYKVHCKSGVPEGSRVVCFHGKPKPWDVGELKVAA